jgi:hypothetical protein
MRPLKKWGKLLVSGDFFVGPEKTQKYQPCLLKPKIKNGKEMVMRNNTNTGGPYANSFPTKAAVQAEPESIFICFSFLFYV